MTEWIKCCDASLPEDGKEYLIFDGQNFSIGFFMVKEDDGSYFFAGIAPMRNVTHYAKLPDPPQD